jgi:hypothetical protein
MSEVKKVLKRKSNAVAIVSSEPPKEEPVAIAVEPAKAKGKAKDKPKNEVIEVPSCPICAEPYTAVVRKETECGQCHKKACIKCVETYMCSSIEDPHCMHCRTTWTRTFLHTICSATFLNKTYFSHRQTVLLNREKSFLPTYQVVAEREVKARDMTKEDIALMKAYRDIELEMNKKLLAIQQKRNLLFRRIRNVREGRDENAEGQAKTTVAAKFIRRCTVPECNGFLSSAWKCGICNTWACPECFEIKGLDRDIAHTCTADALATAALIRKDTKPCPSCGEMISKIDGCDQMWCTSCHTPFSWNTGQTIKTGIVHNPHYFQWLAKGGQQAPQNPGFIPCGGLPNAYHVQGCIRNASKDDRKEILEILRICTHIMDVERHRYERHLDPINNEAIGVQYLLKEVTEEDWKKYLAKAERDRQKSNEIRDILDAFNGAAIDLFRRIDTGKTYTKEEATDLIMTLRVELEELRRFSFDAMSEIGKHFNCSVPWVNEKWEIVHGTERNRRLKAEAEEKRIKDAATAAAAAAAARKAATDAANTETATRLAAAQTAITDLRTTITAAAAALTTATATNPYQNTTQTAAAAATEIAAKVAADGYKAPS